MNFLIERVIELSFGLISAAVLAGVTVLQRYLSSKIKNDKLRSYIDEASLVVKANVMAAVQTSVEPTKAAAADGKLTKEEANRIKQSVIDGVKKQLPNDAVRIFAKANVDYESLLNSLVEKEVLEAKWAAQIKEIGK